MKKLLTVLMLCAAMAALLAGCSGGPLPHPGEDGSVTFDDFHMEAVNFAPYGTAPDSDFILKTPEGYSAGDVERMLSVEPEIGFAVEETESGSFLITPEGPLEMGGKYIFTLSPVETEAQPKHFNFSVMQPFAVSGSFPSDGQTGVPLDSAVEISFTTPVEDISGFFSMEPEVTGTFRYVGNKAVFLPDWDQLQYNVIYRVTLKAGAKGVYGGELAEDFSFTFTGGDAYGEERAYELAGGSNYMESSRYETFLPEDYPIIGVRSVAYSGGKGYGESVAESSAEFRVKLYALPSAKDYLYYIYQCRNEGRYAFDAQISVDTEGLEKVAEFSETLDFASEFAQQNSFAYISFPDKLSEGWYVAEIGVDDPVNGGELTMQKLIQVSPLTFYQQTNNGEGLLWLNNGVTGEPAANVSFELRRDPVGDVKGVAETDENGLAIFDFPAPDPDEPRDTYEGDNTPLEEQRTKADYAFYYTVESDGALLANVAYSEVAQEKSFREQYYLYLYTDRPVYRQSDTVEFWGVAEPRLPDVPALSEVEVFFSGNGHDYDSPLLTQTLKVAEDGTFRGSFEYEDMASQSYSIGVAKTDVEQEQRSYYNVFSQYFSIYEYKKPDYTYEASWNKEFYSYNDIAEATFTASFYDGTPASDMEFGCHTYLDATGAWWDSGLETAATDENGVIKKAIDFAAVTAESGMASESWHPGTLSYAFSNSSVEDSYFYMEDSAGYFPSDTMLLLSAAEEKGSASLTISTNKIDLSGLEKFEDWQSDDYSAIKGGAVSKKASVTIYHGYTVKTQTGTYYDPYTHTSLPSYTYEWQEDEYARLERETGADGTVTLTGLPASRYGDSYRALVTVTDGLGNEISEEIYLGEVIWFAFEGGNYQQSAGLKNYSFEIDTSCEQDGFAYYYSWSNAYFNAGDDIGVTLCENGQHFTLPERGRWMTNILQKNVVTASQHQGGSTTIKGDESLFPNFLLCGAYFDGRRVYMITPRSILLDTDSVGLDVAVSTNAESFLPGEKLEAAVTVRDMEGNPQAGAAVCLGVVNEAVFGVEEQYINFASTMYGYVFSEYPVFSSSFSQLGAYDLETGGKGGGGGEGGNAAVRSDFKDTAGVESGVTGSDGVAKFTFQLPEDITSWRLTALALSKDLKAGDTEGKVVSTLPFFVKPIMNSYVLSGENAVLMLRGFGSQVEDGDSINYTVSVDGKEVSSVTGKVGRMTAVSAGKYAAGEHSVTVTGVCGEYSDGVEQKFTSIDSAMEMDLTKWFDLEKEKIELADARSNIIVTLTNDDWEPFLRASDIVSGGWSVRNDEKLARQLAGEALEEFYGGTGPLWGDFLETPSLDGMSSSGKGEGSGMLLLLPFGDEDIIFTARVAAAAPDLMRNFWVSYYIETMLYSEHNGEVALTTDEKAALLMAVTAMYGREWEAQQENQFGECFVQQADVEAMLEAADATVRAKCYLITALSYLDRPAAAKLYKERIAPLLEDEGEAKFIPAEGEDRAVTVTAAALLAAVRSGVTEDAAAMVDYISEKQQSVFTRGDAALEAAVYMLEFVPQRSAAPVVSYKLDGETVKADLDKAKSLRLAFTKDEFEKADFTLESGTAAARVEYTGDPAQAGFEKSEGISFTREFVSEKDGLGGITAMVYHIAFTPGAEEGLYRLTDWVPGNLRVRKENSWDETIYEAYGGNGYWSEFDLENQLFNAYFWMGPESGGEYTIVLRTQNVIDGEAMTDSAYLIDVDTMKGTYLDGGEPFRWK